MGLKQNEAIGRSVEKEVAKSYIEVYFNSCKHGSYDFSTKDVLFEVKSCHKVIRDGKRSRKLKHLPSCKEIVQRFRKGRFLIHKISHELINKIAISEGKIVKYIFVLLNDDHSIKRWKEVHWRDLDKLLKEHKPISRGDYQINYDLIFGDEPYV